MPDTTIATNGIIQGANDLPSVTVDDYNLEMRDREGGFVGDRASRRAFNEIVEDWRARLRKVDSDPLGDRQIQEIPKGDLDALLAKGEPEVAGLVHSAIEEFAQELAAVIRRFLQNSKLGNLSSASSLAAALAAAAWASLDDRSRNQFC